MSPTLYNTCRLAGLIVIAAGSVLVSASCANNDATLQQSYEQAYGDNRSSSGLLGGVTDTVSGVVSGTTDTLTGTLETVTDPLTDVLQPLTVTLAGSLATFTAPSELSEARFVYSSGDIDGKSLAGLTASVSYRSSRLNFVEVILKDGSKWFFDNAGRPLPEGYKPTISVSLMLGKASVTSSDLVDEVLFFYSDGNKSGGTPDFKGRLSYTTGKTLSYLSVRCKYDPARKWYFDRSGLPLPNGYTPSIGFTWKNNSMYVTSSDVLDEVIVYYTDLSKDSWSNSSASAWIKPFQGKTVDGVRVRLKSDGSKWFFDNLGLPVDPLSSKWYTDLD
jgi:hypothetical protein